MSVEIHLYVTCWREKAFLSPNKKTTFQRGVAWISVPPEGANVQVGRSEDGEELGVSAYVTGVYWGMNEITVEASIENLDATGEYDAIRADILRDGFEKVLGEDLPT